MSLNARRTRTATKTIIGAGLAASLALAVPAIPALGADATPADNPDLKIACQLDVVLAIDASYSIKNTERLDEMRKTLTGLVAAFADKSTRVGIVTFNRTATRALPLTLVSSQTVAVGGAHQREIAGYASAWGTNWQRALEAVQAEFQEARAGVSKLAVFVSDGAPNLKGDEDAVDRPNVAEKAVAAAVPAANALKSSGVHMLGIATGKALGPERTKYEESMRQITGPDTLPPASPDVRTLDLVIQQDLSALQTQFRQLASQALNAPGCSFLAVTASPTTLTWGKTGVKVGARLTGPSNHPLASSDVRFQRREPGKAWQDAGTARTDYSGRATLVTSTTATREYRAVFSGGGGQAAVTSAGVTVVVVPKVTLKAKATKAKRVAHVVFKGKVTPKKAVKKVLLQKQTANGWTKQAKTKVAKKGKYRFTRTITEKGKWRVYVKPVGTFGATHSKKVVVKP